MVYIYVVADRTDASDVKVGTNLGILVLANGQTQEILRACTESRAVILRRWRSLKSPSEALA